MWDPLMSYRISHVSVNMISLRAHGLRCLLKRKGHYESGVNMNPWPDGAGRGTEAPERLSRMSSLCYGMPMLSFSPLRAR